jgi:hypothetical protein
VNLADFAKGIDGFDQIGITEKIRLVAWHLLRHRNRERFITSDITACFAELNEHRPSNLGQLINQLVGKDFIKDSKGLRGHKTFIDKYDRRYGQRQATVEVDRLLAELPGKLSNIAESNYLTEALKCFRVEAYRAATIMTWNLAFDHLLTFVLEKRLETFNNALTQQHVLGGKKKGGGVARRISEMA